MDNQFYPTPRALADRAYKLFKGRSITRLLEPHAGRGDLLAPILDGNEYYTPPIDCIEIDLENQAILRSKGLRVIDSDFLKFEGRGSFYSHIFLNPPFSGAENHVLKAWDISYDTEIVAIVNAATIEKPNTKKKDFLVQLIRDHGSVEYIDHAFMDPDTKRKTPVRIALIYLMKKGNFKDDYFSDLKVDTEQHVDEYSLPNALALPNSSIENTVKAFKVAVEKMKTAFIAEEEASYYAKLVGVELKANIDPNGDKFSPDSRDVHKKINDKYIELKEGAWKQVLTATEFKNQLSTAARKRLESDFSQVVDLEFTLPNIYGLLCGLAEQKGQMQNDMILDLFDIITGRYGTESNRAYYMSWKSNDLHKRNGFRVKMTRFIIPVKNYLGDMLSHENQSILEDIDKVFALLDGVQKPAISLMSAYSQNRNELISGKRISATYFDIRWYPGVGTIHFFPRNKKLMERFNLTVGRLRQWLPSEGTAIDSTWWDQYKNAERVTAEMDKIVSCNTNHSLGMSHREKIDLYEGDAVLHEQACDILGITLPRIQQDSGSQGQYHLSLTSAA